MKHLLFFIVANFLFIASSAQSKYWVQHIKYGDVQEGKGVIVKPDYYVLVGSYGSYPDLFWQGYVTIMDIQGNVISNKEYQNPNGTFVFQNIKRSDWGYYCTGYQYTPIPDEIQQPILLQYNALTEIENLVPVGSQTLKPSGRSVIKSIDENFIIVGIASDPITAAWQPYAIKTDTLGNTIWEQVYEGYPLLNWLTDIIPVPNEEAYYVIGTVGWNVYNGDILVAKIRDTDGQMVWDTIYDFGTTFWDADSKDVSGRLIKSKYGGNIAGCAIQGFVNEYYKGTVVKFDDQFDISWYNDNLFYNCSAATIDELPNGDIITSGCNDPQGEFAQMQIIKLSGIDGSIKWRRSYGGSWHDYAYDLALTPDGGFLVAGRQDTIIPGAPVGHASAWVLKLNCMGLLTQPQAAFTHYPIDNHAIQFINQTQYAYPDSIDGGYYIWDFGDGAPPYLCGQGYEPCAPVLTHQYALPGAYTATLTAIVCTDTSVVQHTFSTQAVSIPQAPPLNPPLASEGGSYSVVVYPNPTQNLLHLQDWQNMAAFNLYSLSGKVVCSQNPVTNSQITIAHLPIGLYIAEAQYKNGATLRQKLLIHR